MNTLEAGKNYVTVGGEATGPLIPCGDHFTSYFVFVKDEDGNKAGRQVWNADGTVFDASIHEANDVIKLDFPKRWEAHVTYALANGYVDVDIYQFEEFEELGDIIEGGRDFHSVEEITIRLNPDHLASMFKKG